MILNPDELSGSLVWTGLVGSYLKLNLDYRDMSRGAIAEAGGGEKACLLFSEKRT